MTQADQLAAQAAQWQAAGRADMAVQLYAAALEHEPTKFGVRMQMAECFVVLGQPDRAAEHYLMVAQAYAARGHQAECLAICERVIAIAPHAFVYMSVGPMIRRVGGQARAVCAKAAEVHLAAGRQTDGLQMLRLGAELDPQNPEVRVQLARIYLSRHMMREAVEALSDAGNLLIQANRYEDYVGIAQQILSVEPGDLQTLRDLPRVFLELGKPHEAVQVLGQLTQVSPGDIVGYEILAQAFALIGRTEKSLTVLERLVEELGLTGQGDKADAILNHARYWRPTDLGFLRSLKRIEIPQPPPTIYEDAPPKEGTVVLSIADLVIDEVSQKAPAPGSPGSVKLTEAEGTLSLNISDLILDEMQQAAGKGVSSTKPPLPPPPPPPGRGAAASRETPPANSTISLDGADLMAALVEFDSNKAQQDTPWPDTPTAPDRAPDSSVTSDDATMALDSSLMRKNPLFTSEDAATVAPPGYASDDATTMAPPGYAASDDAPTMAPPGYAPAGDDAPTMAPPGYAPAGDDAPTMAPPGYAAGDDAPTMAPPGHADLGPSPSAPISELIYDEDEADADEPATLLHMKPLTAEDIARAQQGLVNRFPDPDDDAATIPPTGHRNLTTNDFDTTGMVPPAAPPAADDLDVTGTMPPAGPPTTDDLEITGRLPPAGTDDLDATTMVPPGGPATTDDLDATGMMPPATTDDLDATTMVPPGGHAAPAPPQMFATPEPPGMGDDAPTMASLKPLDAAAIARALAAQNQSSPHVGDTSVRPAPDDAPAPPPPVDTEPPALLSDEPPALLSDEPPPPLSNEPPALLSNEPPSLLPDEPPALLPNEPSPPLPNEPQPLLASEPPPLLPNEPPSLLPNEHSPPLSNEPQPLLASEPPPLLPNEPPSLLTPEPVSGAADPAQLYDEEEEEEEERTMISMTALRREDIERGWSGGDGSEN